MNTIPEKKEMRTTVEENSWRMIEMIRGYQVSQTIYVMARLNIADILAKHGPTTITDLANLTGTNPLPLRRLLGALVSLEVLMESDNETFSLTSLGECLKRDVGHTLHAAATMWSHPILWQSFGQLEHTMRTGQPAFDAHYGTTFFNHLDKHDRAFSSIYNACMNNSSRHLEILDGYSTVFNQAKHVIDVGGGLGAFLCALLSRFPHLYGTLYDLPHVVAEAHELKLNERCKILGGNMFEAIPMGADIYVLSHVIMDHNDEQVQKILKNCYKAMNTNPKARLLIVDIILHNSNTPKDRIGCLSDLTMLVLTGGCHRTEKKLGELIENGNFVITRQIHLAGVDTIIECAPI